MLDSNGQALQQEVGLSKCSILGTASGCGQALTKGFDTTLLLLLLLY